jgi:hypothetical protein
MCACIFGEPSIKCAKGGVTAADRAYFGGAFELSAIVDTLSR